MQLDQACFPLMGINTLLCQTTQTPQTCSQDFSLLRENILPLDYNVRPTTYRESVAYEDGNAEFDEYLTNIEWLGRLSCNGLFPELETNCSKAKSVKRRSSRSKERPPTSYSEIIQLAINSTPDKKMTLQQMYTWVEEHFPYYRSRAKPGWKNCIRQALSIHDVFVRQTEEGKKITFWTMKTLPDPKRCLQTQEASKVSRKPERKEKQIKPILPRGSTSILIPVVTDPPASLTSVGHSSESPKKKTNPIVPKLLSLLQSQNVCSKVSLHTVESSVKKSTTRKVTEPQRIVAERLKSDPCQQPISRRKRKLELYPQIDSEHPALVADVDLLQNISTDKSIQSNDTAVAFPTFKTPMKWTVVEGPPTCTPCQDQTSVQSPVSLLISLLPERTPPRHEDNVLDFSLLKKSPNDGSLGYVSLGFPENTTSFEPEDSEKVNALLGFTTLQCDSFTETLTDDIQNESSFKLFSDFMSSIAD